MTLGLFALAEPSIGQQAPKDNGKNVPPKRTVHAIADRRLTPEPR